MNMDIYEFGIRHVTDSDKAFWKILDEHLCDKEFDLKVRDKRGYIITDSGIPVGVMRYNLFWDSIPFLTMIYIEDSYHGKGFGKQAMLFWENLMRQMGYSMVMTSTQIDEQAQHFYRKLGYIEKGSLFFDGTPFPQPQEVIMMKVL